MDTAQAALPLRPEEGFSLAQRGDDLPPHEHASDAATDIEVMRNIPRQFEIRDEKSANWLVRRIMDSRQYAARVKEWAEAELRRAAREEHTLLFLFGRQLESWTKSEIEKLRGKKKSLNLPAGCVGFRTLPARIVVDDEARVLAWARVNLPTAVVTTERLLKSVVTDHAAATGLIPDNGVHIDPGGERFFVR